MSRIRIRPHGFARSGSEQKHAFVITFQMIKSKFQKSKKEHIFFDFESNTLFQPLDPDTLVGSDFCVDPDPELYQNNADPKDC